MLTILSLLMLVSCATQQERAEQRAKMKLVVAEAVASRHLHIDIRSMNAMRYGARMVTSDFFLELRGDTLHSYLPYLGQAYQAPMTSPPMGLNFQAPILQLSESQPKKDMSCLTIEVKTQEDTYRYTVDLYDTGDAYIHVNSQFRDPISFDGTVAPP